MKTYVDVRDHLYDGSLSGADLSGADLHGVNLSGAYLCGTDLRGANLAWVDLFATNLIKADLSGADLTGALFYGTKLYETNLLGANLTKTNLVNLISADLIKTNLTGTILDPQMPIPPLTDEEILTAGLEIDGEWVLGYRTTRSIFIGRTEYIIRDEPYIAPIFSSCTITDCHPGIYLASWEWLKKDYSYRELVRCKCLRSELIHAGDKWRAKRLWIIPSQ